MTAPAQWAKVDLGSSQTINAVKLVTQTDGLGANAYSVKVSTNDSDYSEVKAGRLSLPFLPPINSMV